MMADLGKTTPRPSRNHGIVGQQITTALIRSGRLRSAYEPTSIQFSNFESSLRIQTDNSEQQLLPTFKGSPASQRPRYDLGGPADDERNKHSVVLDLPSLSCIHPNLGDYSPLQFRPAQRIRSNRLHATAQG
jgi:hypothetical protein